MKVVKVGYADPGWSQECVCASCGTKLLIEKNHLEVRQKHEIA